MAQTRKVDIGVTGDTSRDIPVSPTINDIGVTGATLRTAANQPQLNNHQRTNINPQARYSADLGIGVPYNPVDGTTVD